MQAFRFSTRGIGLEQIGKCFYCGCVVDGYQPNISGFVDDNYEGEKIVKLFTKGGAYCDFRKHEPNWVQVKIGSCKEHEDKLEKLDSILTITGAFTPKLLSNFTDREEYSDKEKEKQNDKAN